FTDLAAIEGDLHSIRSVGAGKNYMADDTGLGNECNGNFILLRGDRNVLARATWQKKARFAHDDRTGTVDVHPERHEPAERTRARSGDFSALLRLSLRKLKLEAAAIVGHRRVAAVRSEYECASDRLVGHTVDHCSTEMSSGFGLSETTLSADFWREATGE